AETNERIVLCLDRRTGEEQWRQTVFAGPTETMHDLNSSASSTPVSDGTSVFVTFLSVDGRTVPAPNVGTPRPVTPGEIVVASYTLDGEKNWLMKFGEFVSAHGFASSPVLYKNLLIVNGDHDGASYMAAFDKSTGDMVWTVPRRHGIRSYCTPLIRETGGRTQMLVSGSNSVVSFDPQDGSEHWSIDGPTEQFVASMVDNGEWFFMVAGYPTYHVMALRPDGIGDADDAHIAWHVTNAACYVPSPVVAGEFLLVADDRGTGNCFDTRTGERLWQARLGRHFSPSLVTAGGLVYFLADDGATKVVRPGVEVEIVAENELGERCSASPALSQGHMFIRTAENLFAIGPAPNR
ncbi:MAG: PQQ-binding-like beta-propeller repeat protein, partial [Planctomycetaceae bacterium]|nr:PQQ-binding-like beta-propeller repeat protein [Planctomycetaceae bacterium]